MSKWFVYHDDVEGWAEVIEADTAEDAAAATERRFAQSGDAVFPLDSLAAWTGYEEIERQLNGPPG
jgi:hypothetical protein